ncbi:MAG: hypothetical protein ACRDP8_00915 [Actinopolymorphaceae bacterium]
MQILYFALAGLLFGGVIATYRQKRPIWVSLVLLVIAGVFVWLGQQEMDL